jgi:hypothetical protein
MTGNYPGTARSAPQDQSIETLRAEVHAIVDRLGHSELRVWRFNGRRIIDIGHAKYGPLDLYVDRRDWLREYAEELSDGEQFYRPLVFIALADREQEQRERRQCQRHDDAYARVKDAIHSSFVIDDNGCHEVVLP